LSVFGNNGRLRLGQVILKVFISALVAKVICFIT
jgi:hypothetical protein